MSKGNRKARAAELEEGLIQIRMNAAGMDIGATEIWVDVGSKDAEPVRRFETFTGGSERDGGLVEALWD